MTEVLKEEVNKSIKDIQENTNNWRKWVNPLKNPIKHKQGKETIKTVQDPNTETESIKKTQTKDVLEIKKITIHTGTRDESFTNTIQVIEDRTSGIEEMIGEINISIKENIKSKTS